MTDPGEVNEQLLLQIYSCYREIVATRKYFAWRLNRIRRQSRALEIVLALAAPGAVGAWAVWRTPAGERVWSLIGAAVVILTVLKPLMNWQAEVERQSGLYTECTDLVFDFQTLINHIAVASGVSAEAEKNYGGLWLRYVKIAKNEDPVRSNKLRRRFDHEVNREIPPGKLWLPPSVNETHSTPPSLSE